jgi:hypothetical protein
MPFRKPILRVTGLELEDIKLHEFSNLQVADWP